MVKRFIPIIISVLFCACSVTKSIKKADKRYDIGEYYTAAEKYKQVYKRIPKERKDLKGYVTFQQGQCYRILNDPKAVTAYKTASTHKYFHTDSTLFRNYAYVLQYYGKYAEALKQYDLYLKNHPNDSLTLQGIERCATEDTTSIPILQTVTLAEGFNTRKASSIAPAFTGTNNETIFYTSNYVPKKVSNKQLTTQSAITGKPIFQLYSIRQNAQGEWGETQVIPFFATIEETTKDNKQAPIEYGICSFTADGKTIFFTTAQHITDQDQGTKIYTSSRTSGTWSTPQPIVLFKDSAVSIAHPTINSTADKLYFVSDAPGGYGGKDLWVAERQGNSWGNVRNLGSDINTPGDEMFPTIRPDGKLYFSSTAHGSYGGLDICVAIPDSINKDHWIVQNIGYPFNSTYDDFGITFETGKENGFFTSNRPIEKYPKGYDHIYAFTLPESALIVQGNIISTSGERVEGATLRLIGTDGTNVKSQVKRDGEYKFRLHPNTQYVMLASARGYLNSSTDFQTNADDRQYFQKDFLLAPIAHPSQIDNIFFDLGKWEVAKASEPGLKALAKLLQDNPHVTIELSAHTDCIGDSTFNKELSQKRANSVVNYLINNGISSERLTAVGYGMSKPVIADEQMSNEYPFIPREQVLDKAFIHLLPQEQQEVCNAINRRIEFKVLSTTYKLY